MNDDLEMTYINYESEYKRLNELIVKKDIMIDVLIEAVKQNFDKYDELQALREANNKLKLYKEQYEEQRTKYLYCADELRKARDEITKLKKN